MFPISYKKNRCQHDYQFGQRTFVVLSVVFAKAGIRIKYWKSDDFLKVRICRNHLLYASL